MRKLILLILLTILLAYRAFPVKADITLTEGDIKYQGITLKLQKQSNIKKHFRDKGIYRKDKKVKLLPNKKGELIWDEVNNTTIVI